MVEACVRRCVPEAVAAKMDLTFEAAVPVVVVAAASAAALPTHCLVVGRWEQKLGLSELLQKLI